ncbi:MAG: FKBP-type peptidyl-prolyl cis-trans isomerase [Acidobacteriaceae bacterium]|jgi:peptidylprolyl isomerase|nr:FKBP-type peptidyl-prolyl cis-trans isomerase [Acidobacteriaceae bacterium]
MRKLTAFFLGALAIGSSAAAQNSVPAPADVAAPPASAAKTASGLASRVITPGTGSAHPTKSDLVTVRYTGWTTDGKMFDSTEMRGKTATFPLDRVIAGWIEGVQLMVAGETRRFWIPESLTYKGQRDPKGTLVFDIELVSFGAPPTAPPDVKTVPSDAKHTPSGLAYREIAPGTGTRHPDQHSEVTVQYSGWTTDGKMFDSSVTRGAPATFPLDSVIPGWTEGMQLMVEGETMRFWIPENLAYKGQSAPYGMLVFDVKLISIK